MPYFPAVREWSELLAVAFDGRSFSDIERDLSAARRSAALGDVPLGRAARRLADRNSSIAKSKRIHLATAIVKQGLLSQRKARELTGVARDTIRSRTRRRRRRQSGKTGGIGHDEAKLLAWKR